MTNALSLEAVVAAHGARLDAQHDRQQTQDAAILRVEVKVERMSNLVLTGMIAAIGALLAGVFTILKH